MKETLREREYSSVPIEGKWFRVNPVAIDQNLFKEERENSRQEKTRQLILEAFEKMKKNSKYARTFKTMIPTKTWEERSISEHEMLANELGDHIADWVEQALEWAQRIYNGESWEDICNKKDMANWYRLVYWKNGYPGIVGGSRHYLYDFSSSDVCTNPNDVKKFIYNKIVPLVADYDD